MNENILKASSIAPDSRRFEMRTLSWVLLASLIALIVLLVLPRFSDLNSEKLQSWGVFIALPVLALGMFMVRRMNKRLARLSAVASTIGAGNYEIRSEDAAEDSIGMLAQSINGMAERIGSAVSVLEVQQAELKENRLQLEKQHDKLALSYQRQATFGAFLGSLNTVDINTIVRKSLDYIMELSGSQLGQLYVKDKESGKLQKIHESGIDRAALGPLTNAGGKGLPEETLKRGERIVIDSIDEQAFPMLNLGFAAVKLSVVQAWPIMFQGQALGVIVTAALRKSDDAQQRLVQSAIDALGSGLNNALTYKTVQQQALRLEQANQELREADRMRSEFVANMSHELRTPLNSVIGFSGILMKNRNGSLSEKDMGHAERINRNGKNLLELINDILDLSKIEAGQMEAEFRPVEVGVIAADVVDMLGPQADARHNRLKLVKASELPIAETDGDKLRQILINLIGNAIKFTENGDISVSIEQSHSETIRIEIVDNGIGIPQKKLEEIFQPFRQADSSTTRRYGGTGLGLTITRSLVELINGKISVNSEEGKGSRFSLELPLFSGATLPRGKLSPAPLVDTKQKTPQNSAQEKQTVLVVDDDPDARKLLGSYVEESGANVVYASGGSEALDMARKHGPDLITLDLMMPGMDGWETLRHLKGDESTMNIPVVIISIVAERQRALILGAMEALTKPIAQNDLLAILRRNLGNPGLSRVLVVDDNPEVQELYRNLLEGQVGELRTADNGKQALELLEFFTPDLIFLDLMMPEMDGFTFLRILRTEKRLMELPVAVVTAKQLSDQERQELEMRVIRVIQKGESTLEESLRAILPRAVSRSSGEPN